MRVFRPPYALRKYYSELLWRVETSEKKIFLTFDDGPIRVITPWVLDVLKSHRAKATFFVVGENVDKHPEVFRRIIEEGHVVGNHTYNHLKGWTTGDDAYLENIEKCRESIIKEWDTKNLTHPPYKEGGLFRPPYGKMRKSQIKEIKSRIIMWDVLSYDFDPLLSPEKCLRKVLQYSREGSVLVFHDNLKAKRNLEYALPRFLEEFGRRGFAFDAISQ